MQCIISKSNVKFTGDVAWMVELLLQHNAFVLILFKTMYNDHVYYHTMHFSVLFIGRPAHHVTNK